MSTAPSAVFTAQLNPPSFPGLQTHPSGYYRYIIGQQGVASIITEQEDHLILQTAMHIWNPSQLGHECHHLVLDLHCLEPTLTFPKLSLCFR